MRPRTYTNEQFIDALTQCKGLVYLAAKRLGADPGTLYRRAKKSPVVAEAIKHQRGEMIDTAELSLYNAVLRGEPWAVCLILKTLGKDRGYVEAIEGGDKPLVVRLEIVEEIVTVAATSRNGQVDGEIGHVH
jgi:hypothetical protein